MVVLFLLTPGLAEPAPEEPAIPAEKPQWHQRGLQSSRSGRLPNQTRTVEHSGSWIKVSTPDGRDGWVRVDSLNFEPEIEPDLGPLCFGQKLSPEQKQAINDIAYDLGRRGFRVQADDIAVFMALETGGTFDPAIRAQGRPNGAVGLAQFTEVAIRDMNSRRPSHDQLSAARLAAMTFEEQSKIVAEYLSGVLGTRGMKGREVSGHDLYAAVFAPRAVGQPDSFVVYGRDRDGGAYHRNASLDRNGDGVITKAEMAERFGVWLARGQGLRG